MKYLALALVAIPFVVTGLVAFTPYEPVNGFWAYVFCIMTGGLGVILLSDLHSR